MLRNEPRRSARMKEREHLASAPVLPPAPRGCGAENGDSPERGKDRGENSVLQSPGGGCAEEREGGELDKAACSLGVHFRSPIERGRKYGTEK